MKTALITGPNGFIARHLARFLSGRVALVDQPPADAVFALGAITDTTLTDTDLFQAFNLREPLALFREALDLNPATKIVYASSCAVYGRGPVPFVESQDLQPLNPYAQSKADLDREAQALASERGAVIVGLRFSNVYGIGEGHKGKAASQVYQLYQQMKAGQRPRLFKLGFQERDWCSVEDAVQGLVKAGEASKSGIYNIGSGQASTFLTLVSILNSLLGTNLHPQWIENPYGPVYQDRTCCDIRKASKELGYYPRYASIRDGLTDFVTKATADIRQEPFPVH